MLRTYTLASDRRPAAHLGAAPSRPSPSAGSVP